MSEMTGNSAPSPIFCRVFILGILLLGTMPSGRGAASGVNLKEALVPGDLDYNEPARLSVEGMPVGNGKMGSLVWTTPSALKFQINRVDVFGQDGATVSFPRGDTDYASGCGYVDINLVQAGEDVFTGKEFHQHLSVYDGGMDVRGKGIEARVVAWPKGDVMAVEIDDQRAQPEPIAVDLRMLRTMIQGFSKRNHELMTNHAVMVRTANHDALSRLDIRNGRICLIQQFREQDFYDSSAVVIGIEGRETKARYLNESTVQLVAAPGRGKFTVLIASAASFDQGKDAADLAMADLNAAAGRKFTELSAETAAWWHDFWEEGFVAMSSGDHQADFVGGHYAYFIYLMNASSRGAYPPRFGGMIWYTNGDYRRWGSQYWQSNTMPYYGEMLSSGHLGLMHPFLSMYHGMYDACALAARQQWGSRGIWIPETTFFNGPDVIPDDLVKEFQDLFLVRKPFEQRSSRFREWVETKQHMSSRYNFESGKTDDHGHLITPDKGKGIFGHTTHFFNGAVGIASKFWQYYEFTGDREWLKTTGYPMIRGVAEFYRNFPNLRKGSDGKYHIHHVNNNESAWDSTDAPNELTAMAFVFPMAIHASEVLGVDADLRPKWSEIAGNLAASGPVPQKQPAVKKGAPELVKPVHRSPFGAFTDGPEGYLEPMGSEPDLKALFLGFNGTGRFDDPKGSGGARIFRNRLRLREGWGAPDVENLGGLAWGIQRSLLRDTVTPDLATATIQVFPAWPKDWNVTFKLLARGALEVVSSQQDGRIRYVELTSRLGNTCRLTNPWGKQEVTLLRDGKAAGELSGGVLTFPIAKGETVRIVPR